MKALIAAAVIVAAHVTGLALFPERGMAVSYVFFFSVAALAMGSPRSSGSCPATG